MGSRCIRRRSETHKAAKDSDYCSRENLRWTWKKLRRPRFSQPVAINPSLVVSKEWLSAGTYLNYGKAPSSSPKEPHPEYQKPLNVNNQLTLSGASYNNSSHFHRLTGPWTRFHGGLQTGIRLISILESEQSRRWFRNVFVARRTHSRRGMQDPEYQATPRRKSEFGRCKGPVQEIIRRE